MRLVVNVVAALLITMLGLGAFWLVIYDASVIVAAVVVIEAMAMLALALGHTYVRSRRNDGGA